MLFATFSNEFITGLLGLVPGHLPLSHRLKCLAHSDGRSRAGTQCSCSWSAIVVFLVNSVFEN